MIWSGPRPGGGLCGRPSAADADSESVSGAAAFEPGSTIGSIWRPPTRNIGLRLGAGSVARAATSTRTDSEPGPEWRCFYLAGAAATCRSHCDRSSNALAVVDRSGPATHDSDPHRQSHPSHGRART